MTDLPLLRFATLRTIPGLAHGLTTRTGGVSRPPYASLNLGLHVGDDERSVAANRARVAAALGFDALGTLTQVHGERVRTPTAPTRRLGEGDALVLREPGILCGVQGADCPLLLLVDPVHRALALVHAGWRGTAAGVLARAVTCLSDLAGSRPADLRVGVVPGIAPPHYEVGPDVVEAILRRHPHAGEHVAPTRAGHARLDLAGVLRQALRDLGVPSRNVEVLRSCTFADETRFFSHRRDGERTGRQALVAGWSSRAT